MSANAISGSHGREIGPSEATRPQQNPLPTFHEVLSALNPLQYLPVVGTIYRAISGDNGSPPLRAASSLATGLLTGGPIGLLTSLAGIVADHFLHFDRIAASLFGAGAHASTQAASVQADPAVIDVSSGAGEAGRASPAVAAAAAFAYARADSLGARRERQQ